MSNLKDELNQIKNKIEERKLSKARLEEKVVNYKEQIDNTLKELKTFGIDSEEALKTEIVNLEEQIKVSIEKCQAILK